MTREQLISMLPEGTDGAVVTAILDALHAAIKPYKEAAKKNADELAEKIAEIAEINQKAATADEKARALEELQRKYDDDLKAANDRLDDIEFNTMLDGILREKGARSIKAAKAYLDIDAIRNSKNRKDDALKAVDAIASADDSSFIFESKPVGKTSMGAPTGGGSSTMTKDQIMAIKDATERQTAIANNMHLFQKQKG